MPEKVYRIVLDEENEIFVFMETLQGQLLRFVVKYLANINDVLFEVLRYDSAHGIPHIDILDPEGYVRQKIWLSHLSNEGALDYAKKDIKDNYHSYREEFITWKNNLPKN